MRSALREAKEAGAEIQKLSFFRRILNRNQHDVPTQSWVVQSPTVADDADEEEEDEDAEVHFGQASFQLKPFDLRFQKAEDPEISKIWSANDPNAENRVEEILVARYKENPSPEHLENLMAHFEDNLEQRVRRYSNRRLPEPAVRGKVYNTFHDALQKYDPDRGMQFHTYLYQQHFNQGQLPTWASRYSSLGTQAKSRSKYTGVARAIHEQYEMDFGREATAKELNQEAGIPLKQASYLLKEMGGEYTASRNLRSDFGVSENAVYEIALRRALSEMPPGTRKIAEDAISVDVIERRKSLTDVAQDNGVTSQKVSKVKKDLQARVLAHLQTAQRGF